MNSGDLNLATEISGNVQSKLMDSVLSGKVAIVTGAGRGIGRAHALLLASLGAKVIVNDLAEGEPKRFAERVVEEIRATGATAVANFDNVAEMSGGRTLIEQALSEFGRLDILVNNAGILRDRMSFNMDEAEWDDVITLHLKGHFAPTRYAVAHWRDMAKTNGAPVDGTVIFTTSEAGFYGNTSQLNYSAAKAGIATMTLVAARELDKYGIRCFAIAPRARTRMTEGVFVGPKPDDGFDAWAVENVSPLVGYLCTAAANVYNGQVFVVGGGTLQLMAGWHAVATVEMDAEWSVDEIGLILPNLFRGQPRKPDSIPVPIPILGVR